MVFFPPRFLMVFGLGKDQGKALCWRVVMSFVMTAVLKRMSMFGFVGVL